MEGFEAFWKIYPRKVGRTDATKAWGKAITRASQDEILDGLRHYAFSEDPKYQPHAASWLNGNKWEYEPDTEPPTLIIERNGRSSGAMDLIRDFDLDVITPIDQQFPR